MRLDQELARILPVRRRRRPVEEAPKEIAPREPPATDDPFEAARERLKATSAPPADDAE